MKKQSKLLPKKKKRRAVAAQSTRITVNWVPQDPEPNFFIRSYEICLGSGESIYELKLKLIEKLDLDLNPGDLEVRAVERSRFSKTYKDADCLDLIKADDDIFVYEVKDESDRITSFVPVYLMDASGSYFGIPLLFRVPLAVRSNFPENHLHKVMARYCFGDFRAGKGPYVVQYDGSRRNTKSITLVWNSGLSRNVYRQDLRKPSPSSDSQGRPNDKELGTGRKRKLEVDSKSDVKMPKPKVKKRKKIAVRPPEHEAALSKVAALMDADMLKIQTLTKELRSIKIEFLSKTKEVSELNTELDMKRIQLFRKTKEYSEKEAELDEANKRLKAMEKELVATKEAVAHQKKQFERQLERFKINADKEQILKAASLLNRECRFCMEEIKNYAYHYSPCGHIVACGNCAKEMESQKVCSDCRRKVDGFHKVFLKNFMD